MRNDGLCLFVDVLENPVKVSIKDSPPSDFFKTVEEINRAIMTFSNPHVLYKGMVYCKPKDASFTFVEMMDPESYWTGGGAESAPLRFFLHNSKTRGDIEKKLSDFNFTPLMDILHILAITTVVRCCHSNLLFPVCHVIFWVEKTKKVELFSR